MKSTQASASSAGTKVRLRAERPVPAVAVGDAAVVEVQAIDVAAVLGRRSRLDDLAAHYGAIIESLDPRPANPPLPYPALGT